MEAFEISATTNTYTPYMRIGNSTADLGSDTIETGAAFQELLTNFPFGSTILTGLFLKVTMMPATGSGATPTTITKTIFDRIGIAARGRE